jgi:hypothetical protein
MKLADLIPDPDALIALPPDELGRRMLPLLAAWPQEGKQLQLVQFLPSRAAVAPSQDYLGYALDHRQPQIETAVREAWAWLESQTLLISDTRFDQGVSMLSARAQKLAKEPPASGGTPAADGEISEEGAKARFARWDEIGLDRIKHDLLNGGHQLVGGPPSVRALAWEWVRMKEAGPPKISDGPVQAVTSQAQKPPEVLSLKPTIYGVGIDLKEAWRRLRAWWKAAK